MDVQRTARITGVLWIITFITSIPALFIFYDSALNDSDYILQGGFDTSAAMGAFLELILIVANIGTAVVPYAIHRRYSPGLAIGFVTARVMESVFIGVGILSILTLVALRQDAPDADTGSLLLMGEALVELHDFTFLFGPGITVGLGNGLLLGYLMYRSGLVPRQMAVLGLVGGPLLTGSGILVLFDVIEPGSLVQALATIPEFFWELSLGIYLIVKGFRPVPITTEDAPIRI